MRRISYITGAALMAAAPFIWIAGPRVGGAVSEPVTATLPSGPYTWLPFGDYRRDGGQVETPRLSAEAAMPLAVMRDQVTRGDYARCVADGACAPADDGPAGFPQTGVSWQDARAYAAWATKRTGRHWRLPTEAEWQRAAAEKFGDDSIAAEGTDPSGRWLAEYDRATELRGTADPVLRPTGGWGANSLGLNDLAGNVWEWTDGCVTDAAAAGDGPFIPSAPYCGVRIAEGRHRAPVPDFVRDASSGGCGLGIPPDHLGFRLVTEDGA